MARFRTHGTELFFDVTGSGEPLVLLHGNTVSSAVLAPSIQFFADHFRTLYLDLPGHGRSARMTEWPRNYWAFAGHVVADLCRSLQWEQVRLIGTSGGALVSLNMASMEPKLVRAVVADSFLGERLSAEKADELRLGREQAKHTLLAGLWQELHGDTWEQVVDADTDMLGRFAGEQGEFFPLGLSMVKAPVLLTASCADELIENVEDIVREVATQLSDARVHFFDRGGHPAMLSNAEEFHRIALKFLSS